MFLGAATALVLTALAYKAVPAAAAASRGDRHAPIDLDPDDWDDEPATAGIAASSSTA